MTKKDIAKAIAAKTGLPELQMLEIVQKTMDAIVTALVTERRIELRGFHPARVPPPARRTRSARRISSTRGKFCDSR